MIGLSPRAILLYLMRSIILHVRIYLPSMTPREQWHENAYVRWARGKKHLQFYCVVGTQDTWMTLRYHKRSCASPSARISLVFSRRERALWTFCIDLSRGRMNTFSIPIVLLISSYIFLTTHYSVQVLNSVQTHVQ